MQSEEYESYDLPGLGIVRGREGTSTVELAGAVQFWHDKYEQSVEFWMAKYQSAKLDGIIAGAVILALSELIVYSAYFLVTR